MDLFLVGAMKEALEKAIALGEQAKRDSHFDGATTIAELNLQLDKVKHALTIHQKDLGALLASYDRERESIARIQIADAPPPVFSPREISSGVWVYRLDAPPENPDAQSASGISSDDYYYCRPCFDCGLKVPLAKNIDKGRIDHNCPMCNRSFAEIAQL